MEKMKIGALLLGILIIFGSVVVGYDILTADLGSSNSCSVAPVQQSYEHSYDPSTEVLTINITDGETFPDDAGVCPTGRVEIKHTGDDGYSNKSVLVDPSSDGQVSSPLRPGDSIIVQRVHAGDSISLLWIEQEKSQSIYRVNIPENRKSALKDAV